MVLPIDSDNFSLKPIVLVWIRELHIGTHRFWNSFVDKRYSATPPGELLAKIDTFLLPEILLEILELLDMIMVIVITWLMWSIFLKTPNTDWHFYSQQPKDKFYKFVNVFNISPSHGDGIKWCLLSHNLIYYFKVYKGYIINFSLNMILAKELKQPTLKKPENSSWKENTQSFSTVKKNLTQFNSFQTVTCMESCH